MEFLFRDTNWMAQHLVVNAGTWLMRRKVLVPPARIVSIDAGSRRVDVGLSRKEVEMSPSLESDMPVSVQHIEAVWRYYSLLPGGDAYPAVQRCATPELTGWHRVPSGAALQPLP